MICFESNKRQREAKKTTRPDSAFLSFLEKPVSSQPQLTSRQFGETTKVPLPFSRRPSSFLELAHTHSPCSFARGPTGKVASLSPTADRPTAACLQPYPSDNPKIRFQTSIKRRLWRLAHTSRTLQHFKGSPTDCPTGDPLYSLTPRNPPSLPPIVRVSIVDSIFSSSHSPSLFSSQRRRSTWTPRTPAPRASTPAPSRSTTPSAPYSRRSRSLRLTLPFM